MIRSKVAYQGQRPSEVELQGSQKMYNWPQLKSSWNLNWFTYMGITWDVSCAVRSKFTYLGIICKLVIAGDTSGSGTVKYF